MGVQHRVSDLPARFVRVARRLQDLLARHFNRRGAQVVRQKLRGNVKKKKDKKTKDKKEKQQKQQKGQLTTCCDAVTHSRAFFSLSLSRSTSYIFIIYTRLSRSLSACLSPAASPS